VVQLAIQPLDFYCGTIKRKNGVATVTFHITLSCGCPVCAGGRFDPKRFKVRACLFKQGALIGRFKCDHTGQASQFICCFPDIVSGRYYLEIEGLDPETGAAGRFGMSVEIT